MSGSKPAHIPVELVELLDAKASRNPDFTCRADQGPDGTIRDSDRKSWRAPCRVFFCMKKGSEVHSVPGFTRNLSAAGVGFVVRRSFHSGEPVEIIVGGCGDGQPSWHMAGTVRYCKQAHDRWHEIGIRLERVARTPVFSQEPEQARRSLRWFREALRIGPQAAAQEK